MQLPDEVIDWICLRPCEAEIYFICVTITRPCQAGGAQTKKHHYYEPPRRSSPLNGKRAGMRGAERRGRRFQSALSPKHRGPERFHLLLVKIIHNQVFNLSVPLSFCQFIPQ